MNTTNTPRKIITTKAMRFLAPDFPGWGHPDHEDFLVDLPAGQTGIVRSTESHGSNPWTRYSIRLDSGHRRSGVYPEDLEFV